MLKNPITLLWGRLFGNATSSGQDKNVTTGEEHSTPASDLNSPPLTTDFNTAPEVRPEAIPEIDPEAIQEDQTSLPDTLPEGQLTITSDVMGTLNISGSRYNLDLFTFLMDAAEKGHRIIVTSTVDFDLETALFLVCKKLEREIPENFEFIEKANLPFEVDAVHIAFDDKHFIYLPEGYKTVRITMDDHGKPSAPYATLKRLIRLDEDTSALKNGYKPEQGAAASPPLSSSIDGPKIR
ncbi:MAG: hypothetical protein RBR86_05810 [Pseudobdellovibrionaceae bacterium]|jgi:hypothetical protein|nr:hypothetical protein [Pseudobdellovibrionaceae bacterium]